MLSKGLSGSAKKEAYIKTPNRQTLYIMTDNLADNLAQFWSISVSLLNGIESALSLRGIWGGHCLICCTAVYAASTLICERCLVISCPRPVLCGIVPISRGGYGLVDTTQDLWKEELLPVLLAEYSRAKTCWLSAYQVLFVVHRVFP